MNKNKDNKSSKVEKIDLSKIPLDEISDPIQRIEEKYRREELDRKFQLNEEIRIENERIEKVNVLSNLIKNKEIISLFGELESPEELVNQMIDLLNLSEKIRGKSSSKGNKGKFNPSSNHVFAFKIYKGGNPSVGDRKIGGEILPNNGFPSVEDFSNPYGSSVKLREGGFDSNLDQNHKEILESLNLLGEIKGKSISIESFKENFNV